MKQSDKIAEWGADCQAIFVWGSVEP